MNIQVSVIVNLLRGSIFAILVAGILGGTRWIVNRLKQLGRKPTTSHHAVA